MRKLLITCLLALFIFPFLSNAQTTDHNLRIMTYNIRYDDQRDTPGSWSQRKEQVVGLLRYHHPDIIGTQEGLKHQLEYIQDHLEGYERFGEGRRGGDEGEFSAIFYQTDRFAVLRHQTFWLSETPDKTGSKGWDAALPRIVTWGLLRDEQTGREFYIFNTHFDHVGDTARLESAGLLLQKIDEITNNSNIIVTGDFNFEEVSRPYRLLTGHGKHTGSTKLLDTYYYSEHSPHGPNATFSGFKVRPEQLNRRIDYIFVHPGASLKVLQHATLTDFSGGRFPSDHLPVVVDIVVE